MKRSSYRGYKKSASSESEQGFWPSYADMMSAVALILFFLMLLSYVQNLITGNDLQNTQEVLNDTKQQVIDAQAELEGLGQQLLGLSDELKSKQDQIEQYAIQIVEQTEKLEDQEKLISDQQIYLAAANNEIVAMRNQMQTIAVLRLSILDQIKDSIVAVMGDAAKVSIGENGNIILSDGVFFDHGSADIKPESEKVLNELIDVFTTFLKNPENAKYVDSIVISGHTDSTGNADTNRALSTERANSVLNYLLNGKNSKLNSYAPYFCAAGYGATRPVADNETDEGRAANRRIEISMILKDDTVLDIVEQYLAISVPQTPENDTAAKPVSTPTPTPTPSTEKKGLFNIFS